MPNGRNSRVQAIKLVKTTINDYSYRRINILCQSWGCCYMNIESRLNDLASRMKAIRTTLLGLTRAEFSKRFNIPAPTIANWEINKVKITSASITKIISELSKENIIVTEQWLLNGEGLSPFREISDHHTGSKADSFLSNPNAVLLVIPDNSYAPLYFSGDLIGGLLIQPEDLLQSSLILVEDHHGNKEVRKVLLGNENLIVFLPIETSNLIKSVTYKSSMKLYKIAWFKAQSSDKT